MRDILIIEDDQHKFEDFCEILRSFPKSPRIEKAASVQEAVEKLDVQKFDLVILDMALPSHALQPGMGPPVSLLSGGMEIVFEFDHNGRKEPVVIVTQYPEIEINGELIKIGKVANRLKQLYDINLLDCIHYEVGASSWQQKLRKAIGTK